MSQQISSRSPPGTTQRIAQRASSPPSARSFQSGISSPILQLQRTLGNQRVAQLIQARRLTPEGRIIGLQRKLTVGAADDQYEQEADRVARQVMTMPDVGSANSMQPAVPRAALPEGMPEEKTAEEDKDKILQTQPLTASITPLTQRQTEEEESEDKEMPLQAKSSEMSGRLVQRQTAPEEEEAEPIQASSAGSLADSFEAGDDVESQLNRSKGGGSPLPDFVRTFMEPRFGTDFSQVRAHIGSDAIQMNRDVGAKAFTHGADIYYGAGHSPANLELTAHELTHVVQQTGSVPLQRRRLDEASPVNTDSSLQRAYGAGRAEERKSGPILSHTRTNGNRIQRRLVAFGTLGDVNRLLGLIGPPAGLTLNLRVADNQVQIGAVAAAAPPSPALRTQLTTIINHATQHAEVIIGRGQPAVLVGAFPQPSDLTVTRVQQIDIDDILAIEKGAPGNGVGKAAHEINENFHAHAATPAAGVDLFAGGHQAGVSAESDVTSELVGPGRRVAGVTVAAGANRQRIIQDFETYYLVYRTLTNATTQNVTITSARRRAKIAISTHTIDNFGSGSATLPGAAAASVAAAAVDVAANPTATVRIEGFADDSEFLGGFPISAFRSSGVEAALQGAGVGAGRIHAVARGATNFVVPNTTPANMALNRRVVITVTRPGP